MKLVFLLIIILAILMCFVFIIFPPSKGKIPAFKDENGNKLENSIAEKCYVNADGCDIGMILLSENANNPVLLVCGGGPGIPEYLLEYMYPSVLPKLFTVCYFDYRGTGLSSDKNSSADVMTTERYLEDVQIVTDYLRDRFAKEKVYIMGHSFGSYIAINTVKNHPEKYEAYFAMSQCTNQLESEYIGYDYMRAQYVKMNNAKMVKKFDNCPIRESDEMYEKYFSSSLRDSAMHELGVGTTRDMDSVITGIFLPSLRCTAYTWGERINLWRGKIMSNRFSVVKDSNGFNAWENVDSVQIPIYFFAGKYDYTCNFELQKEYYEYIKAPAKEFYVFENSAHSPIYEDPERATEIFKMLIN
ncbi:MAG: alpha/beta hydrolase [Lachnospiraceae bacterium]|nr:alpha/beta hydrolase [Lachnospiraceae bacterium]